MIAFSAWLPQYLLSVEAGSRGNREMGGVFQAWIGAVHEQTLVVSGESLEYRKGRTAEKSGGFSLTCRMFYHTSIDTSRDLQLI
jgi:hypothetical protein